MLIDTCLLREQLCIRLWTYFSSFQQLLPVVRFYLRHFKEWRHEEQQLLFLHVSTSPPLCPQDLPTAFREPWVLLLLSHTSLHASNAPSQILQASFQQGIRQSDMFDSQKDKRKCSNADLLLPRETHQLWPWSSSVVEIFLPFPIRLGLWFSSCSECGGNPGTFFKLGSGNSMCMKFREYWLEMNSNNERKV